MKRWLMVGVLAVSMLGLAAPVQADYTPPPPPPPPEITNEVTIKVDTYDAADTKVLSTATYKVAAEGGAVEDGVGALDSGSGGTSTASGCKRVTVNNYASTLLSGTVYVYHTWTHWCWSRANQNIYNQTNGWSISDVDPQFVWRGEVSKELTFYDYSTNDGHPRSAFKHYRMGHFENCVFKYGCIGNFYPANTLRSYYNGTWAWKTSD